MKMGKSPRLKVNRVNAVSNVIGVDGVVTTAATAVAVVSKSTMGSAGHHAITSVNLAFSGSGDSWLIPNVKDTDTLASNANSGQKNFVATDITKYTVGDWVLLYENDYATHEFGKVASIATATDIVTLVSNLTNAFTTADETKILILEEWVNNNHYIVVPSGYDYNENRLNWVSLYLRRMSATNITIKGTVGIV